MSETVKLAEELVERVRTDAACQERLQEHANGCAKTIQACQRKLQAAGADDKMTLEGQVEWLINLTFLKKAPVRKSRWFVTQRADACEVQQRQDSGYTRIAAAGLTRPQAEAVARALNDLEGA